MTDINATPVETWQAWLAVEHEAVWLYGLIGGRRDDLSDQARTEWNRHRDSRDRLITVIRRTGATPDGPMPAYPAAAVDTDADARRAAQTVEAKVAIASLACITDPDHRPEILAALRAAARAETTWGGKPTAFPGLD